MEKFWIIVTNDGESWQTFGNLTEVLALFIEKTGKQENIIAIIGH